MLIREFSYKQSRYLLLVFFFFCQLFYGYTPLIKRDKKTDAEKERSLFLKQNCMLKEF